MAQKKPMKKILLGESNFKKLIEGNYAYVDKTLLIQEILEKGGAVTLIPRPRRFGKTLNLSMLRYFFEKSTEDTSHLFYSLNIWKIEKYRVMQGQFPVIFLSLYDIGDDTWGQTLASLCISISIEFERHRYLLEGDTLSPEEKEIYSTYLRRKGDEALYAKSLFFLTNWLYRYHKKRVILLIDEYDAPVHAAYVHGYYDELISFLSKWLSGGLKDSAALEFGVLTGILHIAKESIFSGLNNVKTFSILKDAFQDKFGLTESEVQALVEEYKLAGKLPEIQKWYDGYCFGSCERIYNPWSTLNCIDAKGTIEPYWVNTSDNALITKLIARASASLKKDMEELYQIQTVEQTIEEAIRFDSLEQNAEAIWSLLLFTGYVTLARPFTYGKSCHLKIPNREVLELYRSMILGWFKKGINKDNYELLLKSLSTGDVGTFSQLFEEFVLSTFSMFDVTGAQPERVYHAFVLGMLVGLQDTYEIKSNRESGYGRYDVVLFPKKICEDAQSFGIIMEFKKSDPAENLEGACTAALKQIEDKRYAQELQSRGVRRILCLGIAFEGKKVLIRSQYS